jgi:hypothetical protein
VTKIIALKIKNLVTPKVGAKHELLFNKLSLALEGSLLNKSSCLGPALGCIKFIIVRNVILVTLCCAT